MRSNIKRRRVRSRESGSFWLSFSDMMSVLVLVFIFVIFSMMLSLAQSKEQLDRQKDQLAKIEEEMQIAKVLMEESEKELTEKEAQLLLLTDELNGQKVILAQQEEELKEQEALIQKQQEEIADRVILLDSQKAQLDELVKDAEARIELLGDQQEKLAASEALVLTLTSELEKKNDENNKLSQRLILLQNNESMYQSRIDQLLVQIDEKKKELDRLGIDYGNLLSASNAAKQELEQARNVMQTQSNQLALYQKELTEKQTQLEQMVGVKAQIIEALSTELERHNIVVSVDAQTGAIALPSEMLFAVGENQLSGTGMSYLDRFLPVYLNVLLSEEFKPHVAEIIIEGHTDSTGKSGRDAYLYNLELSQRRALSVSNYILRPQYMAGNLLLDGQQMNELRTLITASGRSFSALIYNEDGTENMKASRRVEIKFRLKDDETIQATEALLRLMETN